MIMLRFIHKTYEIFAKLFILDKRILKKNDITTLIYV